MSEPDDRGTDIFISYCHDDNESMLGEGWIEQFHDSLRIRLKQILGRTNAPKIWRDKELQGNEEFADRLRDELGRAGMVISIITPSYVDSPWCRREIEEFVAFAEQQGGLKVGEKHKTRLVKVVKTPVDRNLHPEPLQGQIGVHFYTLDQDTRRPREFTLQKGDPNTALALDRLNDLAYQIQETLEAVQEAGVRPSSGTDLEAVEPEAESVDVTRAPIYLAQTSPDIEEHARKVRLELEDLGYVVLPTDELPFRRSSDFRAAVQEGLEKCELSIHMIGAERDLILAGETDDVVALQNELAAARSRETGLERLIWLPEDVSTEDESHGRFIAELQADTQARRGADVLQVPLQHLITNIHDTLERQAAARRRKASAEARPTEDRRLMIYASFAREDEKGAEGLTDYLYDSGFDVSLPLLDPDATDDQVAEVHKMNLTECDAALFYLNEGAEYWLRTQLSDLQRAAHWRNKRPFEGCGVYLGPKKVAARKRLPRTHDLRFIEGGETFSPDVLAAFLADLSRSGGEPR